MLLLYDSKRKNEVRINVYINLAAVSNGTGNGTGGVLLFFVACLSHLTIDHALPSRRSKESGGEDRNGAAVVCKSVGQFWS